MHTSLNICYKMLHVTGKGLKPAYHYDKHCAAMQTELVKRFCLPYQYNICVSIYDL